MLLDQGERLRKDGHRLRFHFPVLVNEFLTERCKLGSPAAPPAMLALDERIVEHRIEAVDQVPGPLVGHVHGFGGLSYGAVLANELQQLNSAVPDVSITLEINAGEDERRSITGLSTLRAGVLNHVGPMDTTHMISNVRVDVKDGADTASLTANAMAQHCPPGRGKEPDGPKE